MITKSGSAIWSGGLKDGSGAVSVQSGLFTDADYTWAKRFGDEAGTNPEELIGAAHAACFSMAFSGRLGKQELTADRIETTATVTLDSGAITKVHLEMKASVPGVGEEKFQEIAADAKENCPVSKLLNAEITLDATLL